MNDQVTIFSTPWCGYCKRLKMQMERAGVDFVEVNIEEDPESEAFVLQINDGMAIVPTVGFPDGTALTNPTFAQVREHLASA
jgi:mycoredoxin